MNQGDFAQEFLVEAAELNDGFNLVCHQLANGGDPKKLIDQAFRIIHTLKGSGASVGFLHFAEDLHELESQLDYIRQKKLDSIDSHFIDHLMLWDSEISMCLQELKTDHQARLVRMGKKPSVTHSEIPTYAQLSPLKNVLNDNQKDSDSDSIQIDSVESQDFKNALADAVQTSPLFYRSFLLSRSHINDELAWAMVSFMQLGVLQQREDFAGKVLEILRFQCKLHDIHRVCLVKRVGLSAEFVVLSAAAAADGQTNDTAVHQGYRCFVDQKGSIFSIPKGTIRTIDVTKVIAAYKKIGRPPQKTIKRLYDSGYKSGAMIPLHNRGILDGLLFFNSRTDCFTEYNKLWCVLMAELSMYASLKLQECPMLGEDYYFLMGESPEILSYHEFSLPLLESCCERIAASFDGPSLSFEVMGKLPDFVLSHGNLAYLLASLHSHKRNWTPKITVYHRGESIYFECQLPEDFSPSKEKRQVDLWHHRAKSLGMGMVISSMILCFVLPLELKIDPRVGYSAA